MNDPACDLAVICAVLSSNFDFAVPSDICFAAEVGLSGEIRPVSQTDRRISEAHRLGFRKIYVSSFSIMQVPFQGWGQYAARLRMMLSRARWIL